MQAVSPNEQLVKKVGNRGERGRSTGGYRNASEGGGVENAGKTKDKAEKQTGSRFRFIGTLRELSAIQSLIHKGAFAGVHPKGEGIKLKNNMIEVIGGGNPGYAAKYGESLKEGQITGN